MYRKLPESSGDLVGYAIEGRLSEDEVERMQAEIATAIRQHGSLRMLVRIDGMDDVEPSAVWQDLKMVPDYVRSIDRFAIIGDQRWHRWTASASDLFAEAAHFEPGQDREAWAWLREGS
jgi:uncharacterized membrane protein